MLLRFQLFLMASLLFAGMPATAHASAAHDQFLANLKNLCGQQFEGVLMYPLDPSHDFAGKRLVAEFSDCSEAEVRVPFHVGEDRSRTWIIRRTPAGLTLQHDHRHADGTPDEVTMYGGLASDTGSALSQSFPADAYTARLVQGAATNVWTLSVSAEGAMLTYHLERDARPRATVVFRRVAI